MIDKLKQYEKSWGEFVEYFIETLGILPTIEDDGKPSNRVIATKEENAIELIESYDEGRYDIDAMVEKLLIDFLDNKRIYVSIMRCWYYHSLDNVTNEYFDWEVTKGIYDTETSETEHSSRIEATEEGILKGFEIYEQQLSEDIDEPTA